MTKHAHSNQAHGLDAFYDTLRRPGLARASSGRWFGGVAAGLARWLGVDPLVVRAAFILFGLFFGMGLTLYLVLVLLMPDERGNINLERALKFGEGGPITLLVITGLVALGGAPWWGGDVNGMRVVGYIVLAALIWWFLTRTSSGRSLMESKPWAPAKGTPEPGATPLWTSPDHADGEPLGGTGRSTGNAAAAAGAALAQSPERVTPRHVRTRTPSIGFAGGLLVLGLAVVAGASAASAASALGWSGNHVAVGAAAGLAVVGLSLVVAGLAGRRGGWIHPFAWLGIWTALFASVVPSGLTQPWTVGDRTITVTSLTGANDHQLGMGDLTLDLTGADWKATAAQPDTVKASVGLGQLSIVVPEGVKLTVHAKGRAGDLVAYGSNSSGDQVLAQPGTDPVGQLKREGINWDETLTYGSGSGTDEIVVDAQVGLGEIQITTAAAR